MRFLGFDETEGKNFEALCAKRILLDIFSPVSVPKAYLLIIENKLL